MRFVQEVFAAVPFTEAKINCSSNHFDNLNAHLATFVHDNVPVQAQVIVNSERKGDGFKTIQVKGFIDAAELRSVVKELLKMDVVPTVSIFKNESKYQNE